ncbi:hypothetical protein ABIF78_010156 [Bradyrhizobium japonicum]
MRVMSLPIWTIGSRLSFAILPVWTSVEANSRASLTESPFGVAAAFAIPLMPAALAPEPRPEPKRLMLTWCCLSR